VCVEIISSCFCFQAFGCAVLLYQNVCGFFLPISSIPPYLIWLAWSSIFTYGYYAIINSQQLGSAMTGGGTNVEDRQVKRSTGHAHT